MARKEIKKNKESKKRKLSKDTTTYVKFLKLHISQNTPLKHRLEDKASTSKDTVKKNVAELNENTTQSTDFLCTAAGAAAGLSDKKGTKRKQQTTSTESIISKKCRTSSTVVNNIDESTNKLSQQSDTDDDNNSNADADTDDDILDNDDDDLEMDISETLLESEKLLEQIDTIRKPKKSTSTSTSTSTSQQNPSKSNELSKNIEYLKRWKYQKNLWKFEKLRQISIQNQIFDETIIDDDIWSIGLEYLNGTKSESTRKLIMDKAQSIIDSIDQTIQLQNQRELSEMKRYKRARELLQLFI